MPRKTKKTDAPAVDAPEVEVPATEIAPETGVDGALSDELETPVASEVEQAVTFQLDGQLYGLPIGAVQEIQQIVEFTPLPGVDPALVGLIDIRGLVVPAIDLRVLVGMQHREFTLETPMVFCRVRGHVVCLIVDAVEDVIDLPAEGLQAPSGLASLGDRMLGTCRLPQGLVMLLDIERLVPEAALAAADAQEGGR